MPDLQVEPLQNFESIPSKALLYLRNEIMGWPHWWTQLNGLQKSAPFLFILFYWLCLIQLHSLVTDHLILGGLILILSYSGRAGRKFLDFALPFLLTAIVYDSQRHFASYIRGPIHVAEPYQFDKFFFGIQTKNGVLTPNEWFQLHSHPVLDFVTGFAYLVFFSVFIIISGIFVFYFGKKGTRFHTPSEIYRRALRMPWAFFWLNVLGYSTYYWYAAAPPWYVALYGLGPARLDVAASSAGCSRFDQMLGTHFFSEMYGRAADVFGAIPSLHVAYPLLAVYYAFQFKRLRIFCILFYLIMCFSAVYLNHHYILDILWGSAYALLIGWSIDQTYRLRNSDLELEGTPL